MTTSEAERPFYKSPWLWAFVIGATLLTLLRPMQDLFLEAPPPLAEVGAWSLVDQTGAPFGSEQLAGKVWVADFFFTRCPSICPELTRKLDEVRDRWGKYGDEVHFVSFTVDPEYDTPEKLAAYAAKMKLDLTRWTFVTGSLDDVTALVRGRMFIHLGERTPLGDVPAADGSTEKSAQEKMFDISHLGRFALFDQRGDLRGTFTTDTEGLGALGNAGRLLIQKGPNP